MRPAGRFTTFVRMRQVILNLNHTYREGIIVKTIWKGVLLLSLLVWVQKPLPLVFAETSEIRRTAAVALDYTGEKNDRIVAIRRLASLKDAGASQPLLTILLDRAEEPGIRSSAAKALVEAKPIHPEALAALKSIYAEPGATTNLRYVILMAVGAAQDSEGLPLLQKALTDSESMIRFKALQALGVIGRAEAAAIICEHAAREADRLVRAEAARALVNYDDTNTQALLARLLVSDPEAVVRLNAALSLLAFDNLNPDARAALETARGDLSGMVRDTVKGMTP